MSAAKVVHMPRTSLYDFGQRVARNVWRVPVVGSLIEQEYERSFAEGPRGCFRGVYPTFAAALASMPPGKRVSYDHAELAGMYRDRMNKACESDYAVLFWLRRILDVEPSSFVFDFGGHVGVSYHGFRSYLDYAPGLRWLVYDMPAITKVGEELAREKECPHLSFTNDTSAGRQCSVFFSAGALQYCEESLADVLGDARPAHVVLNKLPVYDGESFVTVQSTGRAFHAYRVFNRQELVRGIESLGYRLVDDWQNREQSCLIPFHKGKEIEAYSGFYFRR